MNGGAKWRLIRRFTVIAFIIVAVIFSYRIYDKQVYGYYISEFSIADPEAVLRVSINSTDEELKAGVTAYDKKDGDLTNQIIVESISKFIADRVCKITYIVSDSDNNITRVSRRIEFIDYVSPQFTLSRQLCLYVGEDADITKIIGAKDVYDNKENEGDISGKVKILSSSVSTQQAGEYTVTAQVTNSLGDTSKLQSVVVVRQKNNLEPQITLKNNIIYIKKGEKFEPKSQVESVVSNTGEEIDKDNVEIDKTSVDTDNAGCYSVTYKVSDAKENQGYAFLTVVVTE